MDEISDNELLAAIKDDNKQAFRKLYERYWKLLLNHTFKRLPDMQMVEDIIQDVFIDIWERRHDIEIENLKAYLFGAVRFSINNKMKKEDVRNRYVEIASSLEINKNESADKDILYREVLEKMHTTINNLPLKQKIIFQKYFIERKNVFLISLDLNLSHKTVQNQISIIKSTIKNNIQHVIIYFILL